MIRTNEYILLSVISYCNFGEKEYGKSLEEIFRDPQNEEIITGTFDILLAKNRRFFLEYFGSILKEWKVFYVDNRTAQSSREKSSGFYASVFQKEDKYVIAYRGSEKFPLEDAYKDFIETDLAIGLGRIPVQFYEGVEVHYHLRKHFKIPINDIILTGHSLGGGIAQYVALTIDKNLNYIPYTYTWNAVGINREGIVSILDYINLDKILKEHTDMTSQERDIFSIFKASYLEFLAKELKKQKAIKDVRKTLVGKGDLVYFDIDENFIKLLLKNTNIEKCLMKLPLSRRKNLILKQNFFDQIFQLDNMGELLEKGQKLIERVKDNRVYEQRVFNFGHSQDLTFSLFRHIGVAYLVDDNFSRNFKKTSSFLNNFKIFTKSIQNHHFEDVFFPFIITSGERRGNFSRELNREFISTSLRKLFTMEYCLKKRLLAHYFSLEKIDEKNFSEIKGDIISGLSSSGVNLLYRQQLLEQLKKMELDEFSILWEMVKKKLPSPYKSIDIFDIFIFDNE